MTLLPMETASTLLASAIFVSTCFVITPEQLTYLEIASAAMLLLHWPSAERLTASAFLDSLVPVRLGLLYDALEMFALVSLL